ncbi:hypothetical protein ElyMa_005752500 [Elysia marginata]|uniref:Death domain-containing protein n=1 Tax=Elysia marginata TaxID=1093978 RepID=A0AAV4FNN2_9GAST|nr:hypothetical protein ElyMa_005752500 [Elysia marginata]
MLDTPSLSQCDLTEHLSPECVQALALRQQSGDTRPGQKTGQLQVFQTHSTWTTFSTQSTVAQPLGLRSSCPLPMPIGQPGAPLRRYSGDLQVTLPEHLVMEEENGQTGGCQQLDAAADPERAAHVLMMATGVSQLKFVCPELNDICDYLTSNDDWAQLAGILGLTHLEVEVYRGILQSRPGTPSGKTFLEAYMIREDLTVRSLLQALLEMPRGIYRQLARKFWTAALLNNSQYYLDLRDNGNI